MAVQFVLAGLADSTIGVVRRGAATPYQAGRRSDLGGPPMVALRPQRLLRSV
jgi:hypothetical protein